MPGFEETVAFGDFSQSEDAADVRFELALVHQGGGGAEDFALTLQAHAVEARSAHELEKERRVQAEKLLRDFVGGCADAGHQSAIRREAVERAIESLAANGVQDHLATPPGSLLFDPLDEIGLAIIDQGVSR